MASTSSTPIPVICYGKHRDLAQKMENGLSPHFVYSAIVTDFSSLPVLTTLLNTLNPTPQGVIIGGGMNNDEVKEVEGLVGEWNKGRDGEKDIPVIRVPVGTFEAGGPPALAKWIKTELARVYGVEW